MSEKDILDILENWSEEFEVVDILASGARNIGFKLAKAMADITAELEGAARQIYSLLSVLITDGKLGDTITAFKPLLVILLSLSIMLTGYLLIFKKEGKSNLLQYDRVFGADCDAADGLKGRRSYAVSYTHLTLPTRTVV